MNPLDWDWARIRTRLSTFRGMTLLILFFAGAFNIAAGLGNGTANLIVVGVAFILLSIALAVRLVNQNVDDRRGPRRF